jgi:hypothetical protein
LPKASKTFGRAACTGRFDQCLRCFVRFTARRGLRVPDAVFLHGAIPQELCGCTAACSKQCGKQLALFAQDLRHPSLRAKKFDEGRDIWQGRINAGWRFYFKIERDMYYLLDIISHPK